MIQGFMSPKYWRGQTLSEIPTGTSLAQSATLPLHPAGSWIDRSVLFLGRSPNFYIFSNSSSSPCWQLDRQVSARPGQRSQLGHLQHYLQLFLFPLLAAGQTGSVLDLGRSPNCYIFSTICISSSSACCQRDRQVSASSG